MLNSLRDVGTSLRIVLVLLAIVSATCQSPAASSSNEVQGTWEKAWQTKNPVWRGIHLGLHGDQQAGALIEQLPRLSSIGVNVLLWR